MIHESKRGVRLDAAGLAEFHSVFRLVRSILEYFALDRADCLVCREFPKRENAQPVGRPPDAHAMLEILQAGLGRQVSFQSILSDDSERKSLSPKLTLIGVQRDHPSQAAARHQI